MKPLVKWAGGKTWFVPLFNQLVQNTKYLAFVELFAGGAALAFAREEKNVVLNDVCIPLTATYRALQRREEIPQGDCVGPDHYKVIRERFNINKGKPYHPTLAEDFLFLNRFGFNGLYRENKGGEFNVPWNTKTHVEPKNLEPYMGLMSGWTITSRSYKYFKLCPLDLVFADPPYDDGFSTYSRLGFSWSDQFKLATLLSRYSGPVVATNAATERVVAMYKGLGFETKVVEAPRRIASNGDRAPALEMVAYKNLG